MKKLKYTVTNEKRSGVIDNRYALFRANKLLILSIKNNTTGEHMDVLDKLKVGCIYKSSFNTNIELVYADGIYYTNSIKSALQLKEISWYDNGQKRFKCKYENGKKSGRFTTWYYNGKKKEMTRYLNDIQIGYGNTWYNNGQKKEKYIYENGIKKILYKWYENGQRSLNHNICYVDCGKHIITMKKLHDTISYDLESNIVDSRYALFYADKLQVIQINDKSSKKSIPELLFHKIVYKPCIVVKLHGIKYFNTCEPILNTGGWYENGQRKTYYSNDKMNGLCYRWYRNGTMKYKYSNTNGIMNGLYVSWYPNGIQKIQCTYKNGIINGLYSSWHQDGRKKHRTMYLNGLKEHLIKVINP
jgi:antitoxin component YwqK of YwqJK toxin-antitoxin module